MANASSSAEVQTLLRTVRLLERRVRELEGANRMTGSVPRGQRLTVVDADGDRVVEIGGPDGGAFFFDESDNPIAYFGRLVGGEPGVLIFESGTQNIGLFWDATNGISAPYNYGCWSDLSAVRSITASTHSTLYMSRFNSLQSLDVESSLLATVPVGTSAEFKFGRFGGTSTLHPFVGDGATRRFTAKIRHQQIIGSGPHEFEWSVRRTAGAGTILVQPPINIAQGDFLASVSGTWLVL